MMLMKKIKLCDDDDCGQCGACSCIRDLLAMPLVVHFMSQPSFKEDKFDVDATLSDCCKGWTAATIEEFQIEANMCINHVTGIPAANYSQAKYYKSRAVYDLIYDFKVRISQIGIEAIAVKAHLALPRYPIEEHDDEAGAGYFKKT